MADGSPRQASGIEIRPIGPDDARRLARMLDRLSPETVYRRFGTPVVRARPSALRYLCEVDHHSREALVAAVGDEVVGVARYDATGAVRAEVAVVVEDAWQRRGVATALLRALARRAAQEGYEVLTGEVQASNEPVLQLVRSLAPHARAEGSGPDRRVVVSLRAA